MSQTTTQTQEQYPCPLLEERFSVLKQSVISSSDRSRVVESYNRLKDALARESARISQLGPSAIPEVDFSTIEANGGRLPDSLKNIVHDTGCLIIRNVVPEEQASAWHDELRTYAKNHPKAYGFPKGDVQTFSLYWTRPQVQIRSHPRVLKAMGAMSRLWHVTDQENCLFDLDSQVVYADRFRIRKPGYDYNLTAHQDSGAIERWEDPEYRSCYTKIFQGRWEDYDAWEADHRSQAKTDLYYRGQSCSAFRSLQGWLSLSHTNTGEGTLRLLPSLKLATAYSLLRPYFILNEMFDDVTPLFPGAEPGNLQFYPNDSLHPHLELKKSMVGIPPVKPGDYVFWHCDLIHEVDKAHPGKTDSSVVYNPCVPLCPYNLENLVDMKKAFEAGMPSSDFSGYPHQEWECETKEDFGAKRENLLCEQGERAMGFGRFDDQEEGLPEGVRRMRRLANEKLGFL